MMRSLRAGRAVAALVAMLLLAGCAVFGADDGGDEAAELVEAEAGEDPTPASEPDEAEEGEAAGSGADAQAVRDAVDVDISQSHPNGAVIQVSQVRFTANAIEVEVEILNGRGQWIQLQDNLERHRLHVVDDRDNEYPFSPPPDNEHVRVDGGASLEGSLVFLGRIDPEATEITVHTFGGEDRQAAHLPRVDMDIVVPLDQG